VLKLLHHAVFHASREGRAGEIAAWANGASAFAIAAGVTALGWSRLSMHAAWIGLAVGIVTFAGLRLSLAHRVTVWIAAAFGTLTIAALGGGLAWLFAHVVESPAAPSIAAVLGALAAALAPAWSYAHLAKRRKENVRDSLISPVSVPHSR
jgi:hypothetical protein